jgi:hypothetical protein
MRQRIGLWVIGISAGLAVMIAGCPAVLVGAGAAGTVAYLQGDLKSVEPHPLDEVYAACEKVLKDRDLKVVGKEVKTRDHAEISARDEGDRKIVISLKSDYEGITNIAIRIGVWGDENRSRELYLKIHQALQK